MREPQCGCIPGLVLMPGGLRRKVSALPAYVHPAPANRPGPGSLSAPPPVQVKRTTVVRLKLYGFDRKRTTQNADSTTCVCLSTGIERLKREHPALDNPGISDPVRCNYGGAHRYGPCGNRLDYSLRGRVSSTTRRVFPPMIMPISRELKPAAMSRSVIFGRPVTSNGVWTVPSKSEPSAA